MLTKYIIILLCCCVYSVISVSDFIDKGQRAELFELLDNEVAVVKVSIPDDQFIDLKDRATYFTKLQFDVILPRMSEVFMRYYSELQKINFNEVFPGYNFTDNLPQLQVGEDGYAKYNIEQIVSEYDYDPNHYDEGNPEIFFKHFLGTNKNFDLLEIISTLKGIEMADTDNKKEITSLFNINKFITESPEYNRINPSEYMYLPEMTLTTNLKFFKRINFNEYFPGTNFNEIFPELLINEDGYAQFNINEVYAGFNLNPEYYEENYPNLQDYSEFIKLVYNSNKNFDYLGIFEKFDKLMKKFSIKEEEFRAILNEISMTPIINNESYKDDLNQTEENDVQSTEFKTKNATMTFELNGSKKSFKKVTFSISGQYSRSFPKPNYNLKIRGGQDLYGRSHFKLRSDSVEMTYLRTKLVSDIHNRLGLKSSSANYIQLYINDEYMGLYIITDLFKPLWVEQVYGDKNSSTLYKCNYIVDLLPKYSEGCVNENEDVTDNTEWINFLTAVENAKSAADLEDIFEVDHFLYEMAIEYLLLGWDHIQNRHNFNLYKQPNGKWIYLSYDFDLDFGQEYNLDYSITFDEFSRDIHIIDVLILQDPTRFEKILKEVINKVFNPATLFPHIDELKQFIKPYVELDKISDANGNYPGAINKNSNHFYSMEDWDSNSEFTTGWSDRVSFGLKYWTLMKYRNVCNNYNMECDPVYMDENYEYPINEDQGDHNDYHTFDYETEIPTEDPFTSQIEFLTEIPFEGEIEISTESPFEGETEIPTESPSEGETGISTEVLTEIPTEIPTETSIETSIETPTEHITSAFMEKETPTASTDDESSDEEENEIDVDVSTIGVEEDSSNDEEEDTTEFVESSVILSSTVVSPSTTKRITITKTKTINYKTITN